MSVEMKAYYVFYYDEDWDESLLVFAKTANKARAKALRDGPYDNWEYIDIRAKRAKEWDKYATEERIIETNSELPDGAPPFYDVEY